MVARAGRREMLLWQWWALALAAVGVLAVGSNAELYTALVDLEELLGTEAALLTQLNGFIGAQERRLEALRRHYSEYAREHEEASRDVSAYLSNPINAYLLVKRLTSDWKAVESQMTDDIGSEFLENITNYRSVLKFPSDEDLNGAAVALMRLQDTYKLDTASVARGELNGVQYSTELSAGDCFELGRQSYNNGDFYHTVLWMQEALQRYEEENNKTTTKADILEYLAFSTYMEGNIQMALRLTDELLEIVPTHQRALGNRAYYVRDLKSLQAEHKKGEDGAGAPPADEVPVVAEGRKKRGKRVSGTPPERELYEALCRGEAGSSLPPLEAARLHCRYSDRGSPYLRLMPVKEEDAFLSPRILLFHDVLSDAEIHTIQRLAQPRFRRATVQNFETGELETAHYRISKSAWLRDEDDEHVRRVNRRAEALTGLTVKTAEELQVVNYGIGGHYEPHFDFARKEERNAFKSLGTGNRIATLLFYMSDVPQGGATVFPALRVALRPIKGTAAFWFNLKRNGEGDFATRHAACPVLTGSKWVSNKWIHELGQEFRRPCSLNPDD